MATDIRVSYTRLPTIDRLLRGPAFSPLLAQHGHSQVVARLCQMLDGVWEQVNQWQTPPGWSHNWPYACEQRLTAGQRSALCLVFNLTDTVLHINLERAIQMESAVEAVASTMYASVTLEYDLDDTGRSRRGRAIADLLCQIIGAGDVCIMSNNAATVLLMLAATAGGRRVVISCNELVEIGGTFRIPDVMRQAGCQLHEVGTINHTHAKDYHQVVNDNTALLMKVHTSNYSTEGFTKAVDEAELVAVDHGLGISVVADLDSGSLVDLSQYSLPREPMPQEMITVGVNLVSSSDDKLLGGPQAGIIVGRRALIARLQNHPLERALRVDKMTLAVLEATLHLYQHPEVLTERLPTLHLFIRPAEEIRRLVERLLPDLAAHYTDFAVSMATCQSQIGSGSLPADRLPSAALTFTPYDGRDSRLEALAARWRALLRPVIDRIGDGWLWLDLCCLESKIWFMEMLLRWLLSLLDMLTTAK